jgi:sulfur relay (sulfurtransferase) complex TusBCD TusD component (DsrE family)
MSETNEDLARELAIRSQEVPLPIVSLEIRACLNAAERRGIALGRAAERRDVVAWLHESSVLSPLRHTAKQIESGAHLPAKEKSE